jgi:ubiquinol-cytochrome c reductase cytochrome b subunit
MARATPSTATGLIGWLDQRFPVVDFWNKHVGQYYAPKNFNLWYYFGSLALLLLVNQIVTGIFLTMNYVPSEEGAFSSVEFNIMREVEYAWIIRYMHAVGASLFFVVVYLHIFRGMMYGSYKKPRELIWVLGVLIFLVMMAEAFLGYVLPWGQMSFWGAQVIVSLFGTIPFIGPDLVVWIQCDYLPSGATVNRFFALHVIAMPLALLGLVVLHLGALHEVGSNNPDGVDIKKHKDSSGKPLDGIPFHPYYTVKDMFGASFFLCIFAFIVFFEPTFGGWFLEHDNFIAANPLVTPELIKPVWYFTPYYAMLRSIPHPLLGFAVMGGAVVILILLPWLDRSPVKSIRYRGLWSKVLLFTFLTAFLILGYIGGRAGTEANKIVAQICTIIYFGFFVLLPFVSAWDKTKPTPERVTMDH